MKKKMNKEYIEENKQEDGIYESAEMGVCPVCGSNNLWYYGDGYTNNDRYIKPFNCEDCESEGKETYLLDPLHTTATPPKKGEE